MEDWKAYYRSHLVSMEEAVSKINSGDNIWLGQTTGVPYAFLDKLFQRKDELEDVGVFYNFSTGMYDMLFDPESKGHFRIISWGQIHSQLEIYFEERLAGRNL